MTIGTLGGGNFFQVALENSMYKNSEYKSQTKKMILIPNILFVGAKNNLLLGTGKISNFLET